MTKRNPIKTHKKKLTRRALLKQSLYGSLAASVPFSPWLSGCTQKDTSNKPNILFISIDTLRKDHCSAYGYQRDTTPALKALARKGTAFNLAYAPTPTTGSSHATMFTSLYPITHRKDTNSDKLSEQFPTLAEILQDNGYNTAAIVSSFVMHSKFGLARGFSSYNDHFDYSEGAIQGQVAEMSPPDGIFDQRAGETTKKAINFLKKSKTSSSPFFLFTHYFDPHAPYAAPESFASNINPSAAHNKLEQVILQYDREVAYTDYQVGKLLNAIQTMGLADNTLIILTSDHGEGLGQHGILTHTFYIYEEAVNVPLLFSWPGRIKEGNVINSPAAVVDIMPTILNLVGIENTYSFHGQSLASCLRGRCNIGQDRPVYLHRRDFKKSYFPTPFGKPIYANGEKFGIRVGNWKYIESRKENLLELFDLKNDPRELKNLYDVHPEKAAELSANLKTWRQKYKRIKKSEMDASEDDLVKLKALGYIE